MTFDSQFNNRASVGAADIAALTRDKFREMLGVPPSDSDRSLDLWLDGIEFLFRVCGDEIEASWQELSQKTATQIDRTIRWSDQPPIIKAVWEATVRHAVNLIMAEDREEFDLSSGYDWRDWVIRHVNESLATKEKSDG